MSLCSRCQCRLPPRLEPRGSLSVNQIQHSTSSHSSPPSLPPYHTLLPRGSASPHLQLIYLPLKSNPLGDQQAPLFLQLGNLFRWSGFVLFLDDLCRFPVSNGAIGFGSPKEIKLAHTCLISLFVFRPAPYQAPVAVTAAIAAVQTILRIFCVCAAVDIVPFLFLFALLMCYRELECPPCGAAEHHSFRCSQMFSMQKMQLS